MIFFLLLDYQSQMLPSIVISGKFAFLSLLIVLLIVMGTAQLAFYTSTDVRISACLG